MHGAYKMKKKKSTIEIIRTAFSLIAVASLVLAWTQPVGKLESIAVWTFVIIGFLPIQSFVEPYAKDKSSVVAPAIHLGSLAAVGLFFRYSQEPFAMYLVFVFAFTEIYLKRYYQKQYEHVQKELGKKSKSSRAEEVAER